MVNIGVIQGNMCEKPEVKFTQANTAVVSFTVGVKRNRPDKEGNYKSDFIDCVAWDKTAEFIGKHFDKGQQIALDGNYQTRTYEDSKGVKRKVTELVVEHVNFCGSAKRGDADDAAFIPAKAEPKPEKQMAFTEVETDELPF